MPTIRYQIQNEYGLSDPDLYRAADKDDPEAVLEGVAMAGLVGVLRQLGDLAEFAAGIFHDLHEEVTATVARGHGLMLRVQQLEAEFPSIEKAFLVQTNHSNFAYDEGIDWHANLRINQNLVIQGDMPRFILDSYEECRGPPRLFMLDKFDVAGAGACLKRYSDPSFFKVEFASSGMMEEEVQIEKKARKIKKRASRWRNGETTESFFAPLINSKLQQDTYNKVSAKVSTRQVKLKSRNWNESDLINRSCMEHLLELHSLEQKVWPENSISHSPVEVKLIESSELTPEVHKTVIDTISDSTIVRETYPAQSPTRKEVAYIPRNELEGRHVKSVRKLKSVPKKRIMTVSEIKTEVRDDGYMSCKAENRSPPLQEVEPKKSFTDGELTTKGGFDDDESNGYMSDEAEKNPTQKSLGYPEFNPVGEYEDYKSDNISSDLDNYVDALNTIGSEIVTDSESRVKSDPGFSNTVPRMIYSGIYEQQQELPVQPLEPDSVEKSTSSRECNSVREHSTLNSVVSGDRTDTQQPLPHENRGNFLKESPDGTPDEIKGNSEVRECALFPSETSNVKESDVTSIMSEVGEASAESLVMDLMSSPLPDNRVSDYVDGTHVVSQQLDGKVEVPDFSQIHDDFSCETIPLSDVGDLSLNGRYVPEGIDPAECVEEKISEFDRSDHQSKDQSASEKNPAQDIEESTLTLTANSEEQQESVKEVGACFDGNVLPNITEPSPQNGASIVYPAVLAEEIFSDDVNNSHEVARDLDGILPHTDMEFTDPVVNSRILSDDLLPLSDIPHTEDVAPVKDMEDAQGETNSEDVRIGHAEDSPPLSTVQLRASHDPMEQINKSCEITSPSNSALSLENSQFSRQPDVFAMGVGNIITSDEDNAEDVDERETHLRDTVPLELECFSDADDSQKFYGVTSEELLTLSSEKEAFLDDMQLLLYSSVEDARENHILMPNVKPLELGHFSDVEEPQETRGAGSTDKVSLDSTNVMFSADMQVQNEEAECIVNSNVVESKVSPLAASIEHLPLDSVNEIFLDDKQLSNGEDDDMVTSNAEDPKESPSADSAEHFPLDCAGQMSPDDIQVRNKELCWMEIDGAEPVADTVGLPCGSDLCKESLQLEKHTDDDSLDEYVIVEIDDNSQGTCSVYSQSGKTSGLDVQLQENYLPHDAALNWHGMEVKDSSDQENLILPAQNESRPKISTEISSSILPIQHLSDDSNPSDTQLLDNVCCSIPSDDSKPNIDKEDLIYYSSENEDSGSKEGTSPSTHFLVEMNTPPGDGSEPKVVSSHQEGEGEELEDSHTQFQRPFTNDNKCISRDVENEPPKPEPCVVDSKGEANELDTSLGNIGIPEKVEAEASVASRCSSEISELQPIASSSQAISETSLQEALETWPDEPTSSFQLLDVDETPPLPPLPPLEWRLGNLRLASLTSSGDTVQPPMVTNPFMEPTAGEEKYPQGPVKTVVEMFQPEKLFASLPVVENERYQHGSFISVEETAQSSRSSELPPIADEERKHKSLSLEAEMTNPSSSFQVSHTEDGKFTTVQGEWQHGHHKIPPLAHLIPSLKMERSQHETLSVARDPMLPMNPFFIGSSTEEWNHQYGYGVYGGASAQHLHLPPPLEARGLNMPPYGFLYSRGENPSTVYSFLIPTATADGDKPNWKYRSIRDRPRDPLIEAVAAHDKSKLRKVTELDRPPVKPNTDERDSFLEQIRNKSFNLKPASETKPNVKGVPPTNLKVAAILEKAHAIRQACAGSDEDDGDSWSDT